MHKGPGQTLFQGGHTAGPKAYERMLSITSHQRDVKLKPQRDLHTSQSSHHEQTTSAGEDVEKSEP